MRPFRTLSLLVTLLGVVPVVACSSNDNHPESTAEVSVRLGSAAIELGVGDAVQLQPSVTTASGTTFYLIEYKSSDTSVSVSPAGIVRGVATGTSTVTVEVQLLDSGATAQAELYVTVVGAAADAGSTDAGSTDAGSTDAGSTDSGSTDAGSTDAGSTDSGSTDSGSTDSGSTDSGSTGTVGVNAQCAALYGTTFAAVTGKVAAPAPTSARPAKGVPFKDPAFGTCVVRATDHAVEPPSGFARNDYSRRQAFNADNTRVLVYSLSGAWHLYDANTLQPLRVLNGPAGDAEPQWHPTDPNSLYWVPTNGGMVLNKLNVETNTSTVATSFAGKLPWTNVARVWTKSEGSASADGRYWCFMAETDTFGIRGVFTYDLQTQTVLGTRTISSRPDHISMSASGRWCTISGGDVSGATMAWNRTFTQSVQLHQGGEHSDLALGIDGHDYYVAVDYQSNAGDLYMLDIDTGLKTALFPTYIEGTATAYHISGKSFAMPGWVLMSTYARSGAEKWLHERVMAVELKANPKIINIAHHHTNYNGYWTEPHASVSRDFTHVFFSSNWGTSSDTDVDAFMVRLPDNLL